MTWKQALWPMAGAVASFHLAYHSPRWSWMILFFLWCLLQLVRLNTGRKAFYSGVIVGLLIYSPQLFFFWKLFSVSAIPLWCILSIWLGLFVALGRVALFKFGSNGLALFAPFLWTGLEYFRSELYYLKFTWMNVGYVFSFSDKMALFTWLGVYGIGFAAVSIVTLFQLLSRAPRIVLVILLVSFALLPKVKGPTAIVGAKTLRVAGAQMEFPNPAQVITTLDQLTQKFPQADVLVLSEFTFESPIPELVKRWCALHRKYLVAGGKEPAANGNFYNTAYVVDTNGAVIFQQVKSVPVQFMKDGLPATNQKVWESPWGKIGFGLCYDLSYRRVTDELVRQGAQALIFPTMDLETWGAHEHRLHSRIAPMRSAEFDLPVIRVCSSGISQLVAKGGYILASAPYPGENWMLYGEVTLPPKGRIPWDRWIAPLSVGATILLVLVMIVDGVKPRKLVKDGPPRLSVPMRRM